MLLLARQAAAAEPETEPEYPELRGHADSWLIPGAHAFGVLTTMRIGAAVVWPSPFAETDPAVWADGYEYAFTHWPRWDSSRPAFEWDGDRWPVNVIGHGLFGSELYLRARTCRKTVLEALAFTALGSAAWEYGFEGNVAHPSFQDLWFTPAAGLVLGELRFVGWRAARRLRDPLWRDVLATIFDPLGELERVAGTEC